MPSYKQSFPSSFLKVDDIPEGGAIYTIASADNEEVGRDENKEIKLCLHFVETEQKLTLNRTNADTLGMMFGEYTEDWINREILIYVDPNVRFGGKIMPGIRIADPGAPIPQSRIPAPPQQRAPQPGYGQPGHGQPGYSPPQRPAQPAGQPRGPIYPRPTPQQRAAQAGIDTSPHYPPQGAPRPAPLPRQAMNQARQQHAAQGAQEYDQEQSNAQNYAPASPAGAEYDDSDPFADE